MVMWNINMRKQFTLYKHERHQNIVFGFVLWHDSIALYSSMLWPQYGNILECCELCYDGIVSVRTLQYCEAVCYEGKGVTRHISLLQGSSWNGFYPPSWDITWILSTTTIAPIILSGVIAYNVNKKRSQTKICSTKTIAACGQWLVTQSTKYRTGHYCQILGDKMIP